MTTESDASFAKKLSTKLDSLSRRMLRLPVFFVMISLVFIGYVLGIQSVMFSQCNEQFQDALVIDREDGIHFDGTITQKNVVKLLATINQSSSPEPTVWLSSGGGDVDAALYFALMTARRPLRMAVGKYGYCASSCVMLFLSGQKQFVDPTASLALHAVFCPGNLASLECLAEKSYLPEAERYRMFMAQRAPRWYKKALTEHAFNYPPERLLCYSFPNGIDAEPVSQNASHEAHGNCALGLTLILSPRLQPDYRTHASCPIGFWQRMLMIAKWFVGEAENTSRHTYPQ